MKTSEKPAAPAKQNAKTRKFALEISVAEKQAKSARYRAQAAKADFKRARKAFKRAKRAAKEERQKLKALHEALDHARTPRPAPAKTRSKRVTVTRKTAKPAPRRVRKKANPASPTLDAPIAVESSPVSDAPVSGPPDEIPGSTPPLGAAEPPPPSESAAN